MGQIEQLATLPGRVLLCKIPRGGMCPAVRQLDWFIIPQIKHTVVSGIAIHLQDATKALQYLGCIFARTPGRISKGNAGWFRPVPCAIIASERPEVSFLNLAASRIKDWRWCFVYYPAGACKACCRLTLRFESAGLASGWGRLSWGASPGVHGEGRAPRAILSGSARAASRECCCITHRLFPR